MELKPKYQYTYFVKPFMIEEKNYKNYIIKLLKDKNFSIKIWEKEKDIDIYNYFLPEAYKQIFFGFDNSKEVIEQFKKMEPEKQGNLLKKQFCVHFSYNLNQDAPGKMGKESGIFFGINKIEIICFNTGLFFLLLKTCIEDAKDFSEILNFNYKFKEISGKDTGLNEYEKINIQTNSFNNGKELKQIIEKLTGNAKEHINIEDDDFYVYSYTCIDAENWNDRITFESIKTEFEKYSNIQPSNYNIDIINNTNNEEKIEEWEYARFGINKNSAVLLTSSINSYHYTKLPYQYENQYLYTYLIALYKRLYLKKLIKDFKNRKNILKTRERLNKFIQTIWLKEISKEKIGAIFYKKCEEVFETENLYLETMNVYQTAWDENKRTKGIKTDKILWAILSISLVANIVNMIILFNME